jgi:uncharacterized protein (DUF885 family)
VKSFLKSFDSNLKAFMTIGFHAEQRRCKHSMKSSMFKRWAVALCVCVALLAAQATAAAPRSYAQLVDAYFKDYFAANPTQATSVGFHEYDARLEDFSLAHHQSYQRTLQNYLKEFAALDTRKLSQAERDDRDLVVNNIKAQLLEEQRIQMWTRNPDIYSSTITGSIFTLVKRNFASTEERMRSVIAREQQVPAALQAARKVLDNPPRIYT